MLALVCLVLAADTKPLDAFIAREVKRHDIPALSVIVVNRDKVLWRSHYGKAKTGSVYRVGSVSKLFNALALVRLAEEGKVNLDAPVPGYKFTIRHLLSHRAGIIREPSVGSYFDETSPSLEKTVASLKGVPSVYPVGKRTKYSNLGPSIAGLLLSKAVKKPYEEHVRESLLLPLGMKASDFALTPTVKANLAPATMWTYDGRNFPAPVFNLGIGPAGNLYSSVEDQARFVRMLLGGGQLDGMRIMAE
jgi:serine beta-lactamase-like protein LACTB